MDLLLASAAKSQAAAHLLAAPNVPTTGGVLDGGLTTEESIPHGDFGHGIWASFTVSVCSVNLAFIADCHALAAACMDVVGTAGPAMTEGILVTTARWDRRFYYILAFQHLD